MQKQNSAVKSHSPIGASSMERWGACPGSVSLIETLQVVSTPSRYAIEGTMAHEVCEMLLNQKALPKNLDLEMLEAAIEYKEIVLTDLHEDIEEVSDLWVEIGFDLRGLYPGLYGTADAVVWNPRSRLLRVYDFKYGKGKSVEAYKNKQLMYYGIGAVYALGADINPIEVELVIVQPRCLHPDGTVRRYRLPVLELMDFAGAIVEAAEATKKENAPLFAGEHCYFCPASALCPKLMEKKMDAAKSEFAVIPKVDENGGLPVYNAKELSKLLQNVDLLETWCASLREFAYQEAMKGRIPPEFKLVQKRSMRYWDENLDEAAIKAKLTKEFGLKDADILTEPKLLSGPQIEKLLKGKAAKDKLNELMVKRSSGLKLVHESEAGEAVITGPIAEFDALESDGLAL